jgi:hypothetical protein
MPGLSTATETCVTTTTPSWTVIAVTNGIFI